MASPPPKQYPEISLDQAIKDLLSRYPVDAWRFLLPDLAAKLGDPVSWQVMRSEARKHDLRRKGWVMDLPIRYAFPGGQDLVVVVLIEHWATSRSVNLHRTARYVLDLMEGEPGRSVVPVALVTELMPGPVRERLELGHPTEPEPILSFRHVLRIVAQEDLDRWRKASNVVASVLVPAMRGKLGTPDKARISFLGLEALLEADEVMRLAPLVFQMGKLNEEEQEMIVTTKSKLPEPHLFKVLKAAGRAAGMAEGKVEGKLEGKAEGLMVGKAEGERAKAIAAARKLLEHGVSWDIITDSTGIVPADLKQKPRK